MTKLILTLVLAALLLCAVPSRADDVAFRACTADQYLAVLVIDLADDAPPAVKPDIARVFRAVAARLSAQDLMGPVGFQAFKAALSDEDKANAHVPGPPEIVGQCKAA